jgi:uncharacterized membrane protein (UPF0136 family)
MAALPSPSEPTFIAVGGVVGGFLGDSIARILGYNADNSMRTTLNGSYYGTGFSLAAYLVANVLELGLR